MKIENGYWFVLLFLVLFFVVFGTNSSGLMAMLLFLVAAALLVFGMGHLEKSLDEFAVDEESDSAEEKEAEKEEGLREEEGTFRLNDEAKIKKEMTELQKLHRSGKISKRKYQTELEDLENELEELKTGVELHMPGKRRRRR